MELCFSFEGIINKEHVQTKIYVGVKYTTQFNIYLPLSVHQLGGNSISTGGKNLYFENIGRELLKREKSSVVLTSHPSIIRTHV